LSPMPGLMPRRAAHGLPVARLSPRSGHPVTLPRSARPIAICTVFRQQKEHLMGIVVLVGLILKTTEIAVYYALYKCSDGDKR
jgi:hypothetical protein